MVRSSDFCVFVYRPLGIQNRLRSAVLRSGPRPRCVQKHRPLPTLGVGDLNDGIPDTLIPYQERSDGLDGVPRGPAKNPDNMTP